MFGLVLAALLAPPTPVPTLPPLPPSIHLPKATAAPLKEIVHIVSSPLCGHLKKVVAPAIDNLRKNDQLIAKSKPLLGDFAKHHRLNDSQPAQDLDVARLESLVGPLVKNIEQTEKLLSDESVFPADPQDESQQNVADMRVELLRVLAQQNDALNFISGFVDTQQLASIQSAGSEELAKINQGTSPSNNSKNDPLINPTPTPDPILNAGLQMNSNDPTRANDPRYKLSPTYFGSDALSALPDYVTEIQNGLNAQEAVAARAVIKVASSCSPQRHP
jgi:hypothetical protein